MLKLSMLVMDESNVMSLATNEVVFSVTLFNVTWKVFSDDGWMPV